MANKFISKLKSNVPELVKVKGMEQRDFVAQMYQLGAAYGTAQRIYKGACDLRSENIARTAVVLGVDFGEVIRFIK